MSEQRLLSVDEQAIEWFVRLRDDECSECDRAHLANWLAADPHHKNAMMQVEQLWANLDWTADVDESTVARVPQPAVRIGSEHGRRQWPMRATAISACVMMALTLGAFIGLQADGYLPALLADYRTDANDIRHFTLADGSRVSLDASSAINVDMGASQRTVTLLRGAAFFDVTPNRSRPFVVHAQGGKTTVVGTAFNVKRSSDTVRVSVASGLVQVRASSDQTVQLKPGKTVSYRGGKMATVSQASIANIALWRSGRLLFEHAPLGDVLADIDRHRPGRVLVWDDSIARLPVTGMFDAHKPDAALRTIAKTLRLKLVQLTDLVVLVSAAD